LQEDLVIALLVLEQQEYKTLSVVEVVLVQLVETVEMEETDTLVVEVALLVTQQEEILFGVVLVEVVLVQEVVEHL
jgi:hypothetical protein